MSVTEAKIDELDVVALRQAERVWPSGTDGTVIADCGVDKLVEVADEFGEGLGFIWVPTEQLRLVWKRPPAND